VVETLSSYLLASLLVLLIIIVWSVIGALIWGLVQYARGKRPMQASDELPGNLKVYHDPGLPVPPPRILRKDNDK
jgi:heme/copper-type cytochrome/quinol oxidase subunit 2